MPSIWSALTQHYEEMKSHRGRIKYIEIFINHCNWNVTDYQASLNNFIKLEGNNSDIAFLVLYVDVNIEVIKVNDE